MARVYNTIREAGIEGTREAIERARQTGWEWGAYVLRVPGGFTYGDIVTDEDEHSVSLNDSLPKALSKRMDDMRDWIMAHEEELKSDEPITAEQTAKRQEAIAIRKEFDATVVGEFHVHITDAANAEDRGKYFSGRDIANAAQKGVFAYLGHTDSGKVFEIDGRSHEQFEASKGKELSMLDYRNPLEVLLRMVVDHQAPFLATGTEVFAGDRRQEQERRAA